MVHVRRGTVILNTASGPKRNGYQTDGVRAALMAAGLAEVEIIPLERGLNLRSAIADHIRNGTDVIIAAGGDGTVSSVSSALAGAQTPLGVLPIGTLNHFAGDLGIPSDLHRAARVISEGRVIRIDVAKVNERAFVNNSSIGIYPAMVDTRDALMQRGLPKRLAVIGGVAAALWDFPDTTVHLSTNEAELVTRTPFVFVGNNAYELSGLHVGKRQRLQDGILQVCTVSDPRRFVMFRTLIAAIAAGADAAPELRLAAVKELSIKTLRKRIPVAIDGEVITMTSPLTYSICPGALNVMAPPES